MHISMHIGEKKKAKQKGELINQVDIKTGHSFVFKWEMYIYSENENIPRMNDKLTHYVVRRFQFITKVKLYT